MRQMLLLAALEAALSPAPAAHAQAATAESTDGADLAKKLSNPVADLISVPFQFNYNDGIGTEGNGTQSYVNIQPVVPISISPSWNLISRTILPVIKQDDVVPGTTQSGFGSITQSFFFSPKKPTSAGLIWGVGPVFLIPTATDGLASDQWGAGITGVALKQTGPWTMGALANHIWSVTDDDEYGDISQTFLQPFLSYTTPKATSFTINTESTHDWVDEEWSVPINFTVGQVMKLGEQPVQLSLGARYWADAPEYGPEGWGARFQVTFLFPKK